VKFIGKEDSDGTVCGNIQQGQIAIPWGLKEKINLIANVDGLGLY